MVRPTKKRRVSFLPGITYYKPAGVPLRFMQENQLSVEALEAVRLRDLEGLEQEEAARRMNVSRPTFQRILAAARYQITDALLNGKAIKIEGGNFIVKPNHFRCRFGHAWDVPLECLDSDLVKICPTCRTTEVEPVPPAGPHRIHGRKTTGANGQE
ncbi:MAG: DUF134 domain-containing protein [Chloroflexota bacterium]